jgi:tRNA (guanine10-N2)-methyltransferase
MLVRCALDLWGEGSSWEELHSAVSDYNPVDKAKYAAEDQSFKFVVESWGQLATQEEKIDIINSFAECSALRGPIDLKKPMHHFWAIKCDILSRGTLCLPPVPRRYYFGRQILAEDTCSVRLNRLPIYDLPKRRYIGPTSMDPELSFIMCAMGGTQRHSLFLDPFVGTGSVLIAAGDIGAHTLGTDIDIRVIKFGKKDKKGQPVNIWTNFQDYNLPAPLGLLRLDLNRSPFRKDLEEILDVVVADPPYGVRAGARKSRAIPDAVIPDRATHVASTAPYTLAECLRDLVESSARWLVIGGKVAYWIPCAPGYYHEEELPQHPAMEMEANCEQLLATKYTRRLIVMRKVRKYDGQAAQEYYEKIGPAKMALDDLRDYVYSSVDDGNSTTTTTDANGGGEKVLIDEVHGNRLRNKYI